MPPKSDFKVGDRVMVTMKSRSRGESGGWRDTPIAGTVLEVYWWNETVLVKLDEYCYRLYHIVKYNRLKILGG